MTVVTQLLKRIQASPIEEVVLLQQYCMLLLKFSTLSLEKWHPSVTLFY